MQQGGHGFEEQSLLSEPLSDQEAADLVKSLTELEFEPPHGVTLGAVIEATGAEPMVAAEILARMRQSTHGPGVLEAREDRGLPSVLESPQQTVPAEKTESSNWMKPGVGDRRLQRLIWIAAAVIGLVVLVVLAIGLPSGFEPLSGQPNFTVIEKGKRIEDWGGGRVTVLENGSRRQASAAERETVIAKETAVPTRR